MKRDSDKRRSLWKPEWLWLFGLAAILGLHFWFPQLGSGTGDDTYSADVDGKKAFFLLTRERMFEVQRNTDTFSRFLSDLKYDDPTGVALCLLGPARNPTAAEWDALLTWVSYGGHLLFAVRESDEPLTIPRLDIEVVSIESATNDEAENNDEGVPDERQVATQIIDSDAFEWSSTQQVLSDSAVTLVTWQRTVQAVRQVYGNGQVVVVADDDIFSNSALWIGDNSVLAFRLLETTGFIDTVYFDESLNDSGTPKIVGLLLDPLFRPVTIQLLAIVLLYGWWQSRRFGPLLPPAATARHNIVDHSDTVGNLHYKSRDGNVALCSYLNQLVNQLHLKTFPGREARVLEPIALRMGTTTDTLKKLLDRAEKASESSHVDRRTAGELIRRLAMIRVALRTRVSTRKNVAPQTELEE